MRAAERRHAEAQIRATFDDIKHKAFLDITQRMNRSSDRSDQSSFPAGRGLSNAKGMQPWQVAPSGSARPLQHIGSNASVSQIVDDLRVSSGMQRVSTASFAQQRTNAKPPKARAYEPFSHSRGSSQQLKEQDADGHKPLTCLPFKNSHGISNNLMRLTSCVKLS